MTKQHRRKLLLLAALLCAACLLLSGCIMEPEGPNNTDDASTWKRYTEIPVTEEPTSVPAETPTPDPNQQSWDVPTGPLETASPTPTIGVATIPPNLIATDTPSPDPNATDSIYIRKGDQGERVRNIQESLRRLGYFEGKADGDFGDYTENAVKEFQRMNKLTPDGIVGPSTLAKLGSSSAATAGPKVTPSPKPTATPKRTATPKPTKRVTATPKHTATPKISSNTYLTHGSTGDKVKQMQNRLISLGYLAGSATGRVDNITEQAILAFQKRNNLDDDGIAGPCTLEKMYSNSARSASSVVGVIGTTLKRGDEGAGVRALQTRLKKLGYLSGAVDGSYGAATEEAIRAFQRDNGISADGKAGHSTLQKLFSNVVTSSLSGVGSGESARTPTPIPNTFIRVTKSPNGDYVTLEKGTMGNLVSKLQRALKNAGYFGGTVDGYYGEDTAEAVKRFQRDKGLTQDGKAGPATQRYLFEGDFPNES